MDSAFNITAYGLCVALAALGYFMLLIVAFKSVRLQKGTAAVFMALALPICLLASRVVFCLSSAGYFLQTVAQPAKMLNFFDGGYAMTGVILGAALAGFLTAKITKQSFPLIMDGAVLFAGVFIAALRLAEPLTTLGLGREVINQALRSNAFFAFLDETETLRHAVFRYEAVVAIAIALVMLFVKSKKWHPGDKTLLFVSLYGAAQVILESMRDDFHMLWGFVRAQQIYALLLPVLAIIIFSVRIRKKQGITKELVICWVLAAAAIVLGVIKEFDVDTSPNLFVDYGIMAAAVAVVAAVSCYLLAKSNKVSLSS